MTYFRKYIVNKFYIYTVILLVFLILAGCKKSSVEYYDVCNSNKTIENILINKKDAVIFFTQDLCSGCKQMSKSIKKYSKKYKCKCYVIDEDKINDKVRLYLEKYSITTTPTLIEIKNKSISCYDEVNDKTINKIFKRHCKNLIKYERFDKIVEITYDKLKAKMDLKTDFIVYIGRTDCRDCQKFHPILEKFIKDNSYAGVYYFNVQEYRDLENNSSDMTYSKIKKDFDLKWVPSVYHICSGKIVDKYMFLEEKYYDLDKKEQQKMLNDYIDKLDKWMKKNL